MSKTRMKKVRKGDKVLRGLDEGKKLLYTRAHNPIIVSLCEPECISKRKIKKNTL